MSRQDWFSLDAKGRAIVPLRVTPRAGRAAIEGVGDDGHGGRALNIAVRAAPADGKANQAVIALLAEALGLAKRRIDIAAGAAGRRKLVRIADADAAIVARLRQWSTP